MTGVELEEQNVDAQKIVNEMLDAPSESALQRRGSKRFRNLTDKVSGLNLGAAPEKRRNSTFLNAVKSATNSR